MSSPYLITQQIHVVAPRSRQTFTERQGGQTTIPHSLRGKCPPRLSSACKIPAFPRTHDCTSALLVRHCSKVKIQLLRQAHDQLCCAQQTGVHRMVGSNCLVTIYLPEEKRTSIYVCPTYLATWAHVTTQGPLCHSGTTSPPEAVGGCKCE